MNRTARILLGLLAFALLAGWCLSRAGAIQNRLRDQVSEQLGLAGLSGIRVSADGLDITLAGTLPSEETLAQAQQIASDHPGSRRLYSRLKIGRPGGLRLVSADGRLTLAGAFAAESTRDRLLAATATLWGELYDDAGLALDPRAVAVERPDALVSVIALLRDQPGSFDLAWGPPVAVAGEVASEEAKASFLGRLEALVAGWPVSESIRVAPRALAEEIGRLLAERPVEFASDSDRLTRRGEELLDEVVRLLAGAPSARFSIEGHTDGSGGVEHNLDLSRRRADAVRDYLAAAGLDAGRFETIGFGASRPVASNDTAEGREHNRRVDFRLLEEEAP